MPNVRTYGRTKGIKFITEYGYYFCLDNDDGGDDKSLQPCGSTDIQGVTKLCAQTL
jgi:hypothetical protein